VRQTESVRALCVKMTGQYYSTNRPTVTLASRAVAEVDHTHGVYFSGFCLPWSCTLCEAPVSGLSKVRENVVASTDEKMRADCRMVVSETVCEFLFWQFIKYGEV